MKHFKRKSKDTDLTKVVLVVEMLNFIIAVLAVLILVSGLYYTYKLGRSQEVAQSKYDTEINEKVQDHIFIRNPVFITYAVGLFLVIAYIVYLTISM